MTSSPRPGQRWHIDCEPQNGLGILTEITHRTLTLSFPATGETRTYARESAPLTRICFGPGDPVRNLTGNEITISKTEEKDGLMTYQGLDQDGQSIRIPEQMLDPTLRLDHPGERLLNGLVDRPQWFNLRLRTMQALQDRALSPLRGLNGCRTSLIPHQLYIAHEVASRYAPRVLLADEVGLGKTIEAGLILNQQLISERAQRCLIVVPDNLIYQWLVELLRRFNLHCSLFDDDAWSAQNTQGDNPFLSEQIVLCSTHFLLGDEHRQTLVKSGQWDLMIVDEAHHLQWSPGSPSPAYRLIADLAAVTPGVLLLTATPEQLGKAGHFARLHLLDPNRFSDLERYLAEETDYPEIARIVSALIKGIALTPQQQTAMEAILDDADERQLMLQLSITQAPQDIDALRLDLAERLIDRHGTGRILFRNTRAVITGFPSRHVQLHSLARPDAYVHPRNHTQNDSGHHTGHHTGRHTGQAAIASLTPEHAYRDTAGSHAIDWTTFDPRIQWLIDFIRQCQRDKILLITHHARTAIDMAAALRKQAGIHAALFHEGMTLIERDRAASFFAHAEDGARLMICSEIGSEGRNFQFAHRLVLFDLPLNPDMLEQRIGRLDRIGQQRDILIEVPFLENSAQSLMAHWYQDGLDAFEHACPAGMMVFNSLADRLDKAMQHPDKAIKDLMADTRQLNLNFNTTLQQGRDRLLEYHSYRPKKALTLYHAAIAEDQNNALPAFLESVYDCFGIHSEDHGNDCQILHPDNSMSVQLPGLPEDGMTVTTQRDTALGHEQVAYLTWDHPLVTRAMDLIVNRESGNSAAVTCTHLTHGPDTGGQAFGRGKLLLEVIHCLEIPATIDSQKLPALPPIIIRTLVDESGHAHQGHIRHEDIQAHSQDIGAEFTKALIERRGTAIRELITFSETEATHLAPAHIARIQNKIQGILQAELDRLIALQRVNPHIRNDEIRYFREQIKQHAYLFAHSHLRVDAIQLIIAV